VETIKPDITKLLDVTTAAILPGTDRWLTQTLDSRNGVESNLIVYKHDVGYFIHLHPKEDNDKFEDWRPGVPYELVKLLEWAQDNGCGWVLLHGGGGPVPEGLPSFDW
jgi:hypothetical protein